MIDFLRTIVDGISSITTFLADLGKGLIDVIAKIPEYTEQLTEIINSYVPLPFVGILVGAIALAVALLIAGR